MSSGYRLTVPEVLTLVGVLAAPWSIYPIRCYPDAGDAQADTVRTLGGSQSGCAGGIAERTCKEGHARG